MIARVGTVAVTVQDQDKALDFYVNSLGFEKRDDQPFGEGYRWLTVAPKGAETNVVLEPAGPEDHVGAWANMVLECDDIHATYEELSGRGVEFSEKPSEQPWGMWARFKDIDDNEFGLYSSK